MPTLQDIKRRIASVRKTQQITRAMRMVAAAKLRRAEAAISSARPYADRMRGTLAEVARVQKDSEHPLLQVRDEVKRLDVVVVTSDRGLAGAFNANVLKRADRLLADREVGVEGIELNLIGRKCGDYYTRRRSGQVAERAEFGGGVTYEQAATAARRLIRRYSEGETDEVLLVYSEFVSTMTQAPKVIGLLPITPDEELIGEETRAAGPEGEDALPYEIEPDPETLLATLVPKAVEVEIFRALLESQAGEHAARMTAMENATRNTEELIEQLTLDFNRARQAAITKELVEIVTGAQALE